MAREKHKALLANPVAIALGLDEPNGPSVVLGQALEAVGESSGEHPNVLYIYFLDACEKVFANELDQATFEEHMRWFFRTKVSVYFCDSPAVAETQIFYSLRRITFLPSTRSSQPLSNR